MTLVEKEIPETRTLTWMGATLAGVEILFMAVYLMGMMAALNLLQAYTKPYANPQAEFFILLAGILILLEKFAYTFMRVTNPMKHYQTEAEYEEVEEPDQEGEPEIAEPDQVPQPDDPAAPAEVAEEHAEEK